MSNCAVLVSNTTQSKEVRFSISKKTVLVPQSTEKRQRQATFVAFARKLESLCYNDTMSLTTVQRVHREMKPLQLPKEALKPKPYTSFQLPPGELVTERFHLFATNINIFNFQLFSINSSFKRPFLSNK